MDLRSASMKDRKGAEQEANLLQSLRHPNIVPYRDSFEVDGVLHIVMGFCDGGDLYQKLKAHSAKYAPAPAPPFDERIIVQWFIQIAMALQVYFIFP